MNRKYFQGISDKILSSHRAHKVGNKINKEENSFILKKSFDDGAIKIFIENFVSTHRRHDGKKMFMFSDSTLKVSTSVFSKQEGKIFQHGKSS